MKDETLNCLYMLMKENTYAIHPDVRVSRSLIDNYSYIYCFIIPQKNKGSKYLLEYYDKISFLIYLMCKNRKNVSEIVDKLATMNNSPSKMELFNLVIHTIRDFQTKEILL